MISLQDGSVPLIQLIKQWLGLPEIVVLCGSTKFVELFDQESLRLTLEGKIVLSIGSHRLGDHGLNLASYKPMLDGLHKRKIDLADSVYVINPGNYIGDSTRSEIEYATSLGLPISYFHDEVMQSMADQQNDGEQMGGNHLG